MTPASPTPPEALHRFALDRIATPIGRMLMVVDGQARLRALDWQDYEARMHELLRRHYGREGYVLADGRAPAALREPIEAYFAGALRALDRIETATGGTPFQRRVWTALRDIPAGSTQGYATLAARIGAAGAARAVGLANGANPIGIVVPCHRVIGADGRLTGYGGGIGRKRWLLEHEGAALRHAAARSPEVNLPLPLPRAGIGHHIMETT